MDDELLRLLYHELFHRARGMRPRGCCYGDGVVLFIYFLSVMRQRSVRSVYAKRAWPVWARRLESPSYSQVMRRLNTDSIRRRIDQLSEKMRDRLPRSSDKCCDGKPLVVGHFSKDRDARRGILREGHWARGYKVHAIVDACGAVDAAEVTALNAGESTIARRLAERADLSGCVVRGDANYDSNPLYEAVADRGGRLVAPRRKPGRGLGWRKHHPDRLRAVDELEHDKQASRQHKRHRARIEQAFAHLTNLPFGLSPLPNCVRRLHRVQRYVATKIMLYHLYLVIRNTQKHAA